MNMFRVELKYLAEIASRILKKKSQKNMLKFGLSMADYPHTDHPFDKININFLRLELSPFGL